MSRIVISPDLDEIIDRNKKDYYKIINGINKEIFVGRRRDSESLKYEMRNRKRRSKTISDDDYESNRRRRRNYLYNDFFHPALYKDVILPAAQKVSTSPGELEEQLNKILWLLPELSDSRRFLWNPNNNVATLLKKYDRISSFNRDDLESVAKTFVDIEDKSDYDYRHERINGLIELVNDFRSQRPFGLDMMQYLKRAPNHKFYLFLSKLDEFKEHLNKTDLEDKVKEILDIVVMESSTDIGIHIDNSYFKPFIELKKEFSENFSEVIDHFVKTKTNLYSRVKIVSSLLTLKFHGLSGSLDEILDTARMIESVGLDQDQYFSEVARTKKLFSGEEGYYVPFAIDIARYSKRAANLMLYTGLSLFIKDPDKRQLFVGKGFELLEEFGDDAAHYFDNAQAVMELGQEKFNHWIEYAKNIGRIDKRFLPDFLMTSGYALSNGFLDNFTSEYLSLRRKHDEFLVMKRKQFEREWNEKNLENYSKSSREDIENSRLHEVEDRLKKIQEWYKGFNSILGEFQKYPLARKLGVDFNVWSDLIWKSFNKEDNSDYIRNIDYYLEAVKNGFDSDKTAEIYHDLVDFRLIDNFFTIGDFFGESKKTGVAKVVSFVKKLFKKTRVSLRGDYHSMNIRELVNSDISADEKIEIFSKYSLVKDIAGVPNPTTDGSWLIGARDASARYFENNWKMSSKGLDLDDLMMLSDLGGQGNRDKVKYLISLHQRGKMPQKDYSLGKVYGTLEIGSLRESFNPVQMTEQLVYGLVSRKPELRSAAEAYFDPEKLSSARSQINSERVFNTIRPYLEELKTGSRDSAINVLKKLREMYPGKEDLGDLVSDIESLFSDKVTYDGLVFKMQDHTIKDLFDNRRLRACVFYPTGVSIHAENYALDRDMGLLHIVPRSKGKLLSPVGVGILCNCYDSDKRKVLLADSIEGGASIERIERKGWMKMMFNSILDVARDNGCYSVFIESYEHANKTAKKFVDYVIAETGLSVKEKFLQKCTGFKDLDAYWITKGVSEEEYERKSDSQYIEAFRLADPNPRYLKGKKSKGLEIIL